MKSIFTNRKSLQKALRPLVNGLVCENHGTGTMEHTSKVPGVPKSAELRNGTPLTILSKELVPFRVTRTGYSGKAPWWPLPPPIPVPGNRNSEHRA